MSDSEELNRLADLHQRGVLSDEEFAQAKARVLNGTSGGRSGGGDAGSVLSSLRRSRDDRWVGGVCGGLAQITGMASWFWRLAFTLLVLCAGTGVLLYLLLWIFLPED